MALEMDESQQPTSHRGPVLPRMSVLESRHRELVSRGPVTLSDETLIAIANLWRDDFAQLRYDLRPWYRKLMDYFRG